MVSVYSLVRLAALLAAGFSSAAQTTPESTVPPATTTPELSPEKRADILMARKMYREAIDLYKQAPQDSAIIWNKIGIANHQMLQLEVAKKHYEKAIKLNPKYSEAINNLGTIYYARKSYRRAAAHYNRALKLAPKSASIYSNLGTAEFARKRYKQAFEAYTTALSIDPEVFEHRSAYGTMLQERSVQEKAKFHYYLAKTYAQANMHERALQYLRMALEEGFKEKDKLLEEPEFATLRETAEFKALIATEPRVL